MKTTPLVINVSLNVTALGADGYRVAMAGIPDEPATTVDCLGVHPRIELYGRLFAAARDIPEGANVNCTVLGEIVWWLNWPYSVRKRTHGQFSTQLDAVLDADARLNECQEAA